MKKYFCNNYKITKYKKFFLYINIIIFFLNLFYLKKILFFFDFLKYKNIDKFIIYLISKSYFEIADFLNKKYSINANLYLNKQIFPKKKINLYIDNNLNVDRQYFISMISYYIKPKFIIEINNNNPDYLIYNVLGKNHLHKKFENIIKIAFYTENKIIDFDEADYAIGLAHINYLDRYLYFPLGFIRNLKLINYKNLNNIRKKIIFGQMRKKFCGAVISNIRSTDYFRIKFIKELSKYKKIDMGGKYNNNIGGPVKNKTEFLSLYKFSISMENTNGDGYISEKIIQSFYSGTIPIYYGNYMLDEFINPKSYILIKGQNDMKDKIEFIKKIDNDDKLYKSILMEKVFINDNIIENYELGISNFLNHIFEQDKKKAKRIFNLN